MFPQNGTGRDDPEWSTPPTSTDPTVSIEPEIFTRLEYSLQHRPDKRELVEQHIYPNTTGLDPGLHPALASLKHSIFKDQLAQRLRRRQPPHQHQNSSLQHRIKQLQKLLYSQSLKQFLTSRPSIDQLTAGSNLLQPTAVWTRHHPNGVMFSPRNCHTAVLGDYNEIFIIGGFSTDAPTKPTPISVSVLNVNRMSVTQPIIVGHSPTDRYSHSSCRFNNGIYIFGGYIRSDSRWSNSLHVLSVEQATLTIDRHHHQYRNYLAAKRGLTSSLQPPVPPALPALLQRKVSHTNTIGVADPNTANDKASITSGGTDAQANTTSVTELETVPTSELPSASPNSPPPTTTAADEASSPASTSASQTAPLSSIVFDPLVPPTLKLQTSKKDKKDKKDKKSSKRDEAELLESKKLLQSQFSQLCDQQQMLMKQHELLSQQQDEQLRMQEELQQYYTQLAEYQQQVQKYTTTIQQTSYHPHYDHADASIPAVMKPQPHFVLCWRALRPFGYHPRPRAAHTMTMIPHINMFYIYGGNDASSYFSELYCCDVVKNVWVNIIPEYYQHYLVELQLQRISNKEKTLSSATKTKAAVVVSRVSSATVTALQNDMADHQQQPVGQKEEAVQDEHANPEGVSSSSSQLPQGVPHSGKDGSESHPTTDQDRRTIKSEPNQKQKDGQDVSTTTPLMPDGDHPEMAEQQQQHEEGHGPSTSGDGRSASASGSEKDQDRLLTLLHAKQQPPSGRAGHSAILLQNRYIVLFGGNTPRGATNELLCIDTQPEQPWQQPQDQQQNSSQQTTHRRATVSSSEMGKEYKGVAPHSSRVPTTRVRYIPVYFEGDVPPPRAGHSMALVGETRAVLMGGGHLDELDNRVYTADFSFQSIATFFQSTSTSSSPVSPTSPISHEGHTFTPNITEEIRDIRDVIADCPEVHNQQVLVVRWGRPYVVGDSPSPRAGMTLTPFIPQAIDEAGGAAGPTAAHVQATGQQPPSSGAGAGGSGAFGVQHCKLVSIGGGTTTALNNDVYVLDSDLLLLDTLHDDHHSRIHGSRHINLSRDDGIGVSSTTSSTVSYSQDNNAYNPQNRTTSTARAAIQTAATGMESYVTTHGDKETTNASNTNPRGGAASNGGRRDDLRLKYTSSDHIQGTLQPHAVSDHPSTTSELSVVHMPYTDSNGTLHPDGIEPRGFVASTCTHRQDENSITSPTSTSTSTSTMDASGRSSGSSHHTTRSASLLSPPSTTSNPSTSQGSSSSSSSLASTNPLTRSATGTTSQITALQHNRGRESQGIRLAGATAGGGDDDDVDDVDGSNPAYNYSTLLDAYMINQPLYSKIHRRAAEYIDIVRQTTHPSTYSVPTMASRYAVSSVAAACADYITLLSKQSETYVDSLTNPGQLTEIFASTTAAYLMASHSSSPAAAASPALPDVNAPAYYPSPATAVTATTTTTTTTSRGKGSGAGQSKSAQMVTPPTRKDSIAAPNRAGQAISPADGGNDGDDAVVPPTRSTHHHDITEQINRGRRAIREITRSARARIKSLQRHYKKHLTEQQRQWIAVLELLNNWSLTQLASHVSLCRLILDQAMKEMETIRQESAFALLGLYVTAEDDDVHHQQQQQMTTGGKKQPTVEGASGGASQDAVNGDTDHTKQPGASSGGATTVVPLSHFNTAADGNTTQGKQTATLPVSNEDPASSSSSSPIPTSYPLMSIHDRGGRLSPIGGHHPNNIIDSLTQQLDHTMERELKRATKKLTSVAMDLCKTTTLSFYIGAGHHNYNIAPLSKPNSHDHHHDDDRRSSFPQIHHHTHAQSRGYDYHSHTHQHHRQNIERHQELLASAAHVYDFMLIGMKSHHDDDDDVHGYLESHGTQPFIDHIDPKSSSTHHHHATSPSYHPHPNGYLPSTAAPASASASSWQQHQPQPQHQHQQFSSPRLHATPAIDPRAPPPAHLRQHSATSSSQALSPHAASVHPQGYLISPALSGSQPAGAATASILGAIQLPTHSSTTTSASASSTSMPYTHHQLSSYSQQQQQQQQQSSHASLAHHQSLKQHQSLKEPGGGAKQQHSTVGSGGGGSAMRSSNSRSASVVSSHGVGHPAPLAGNGGRNTSHNPININSNTAHGGPGTGAGTGGSYGSGHVPYFHNGLYLPTLPATHIPNTPALHAQHPSAGHYPAVVPQDLLGDVGEHDGGHGEHHGRHHHRGGDGDGEDTIGPLDTVDNTNDHGDIDGTFHEFPSPSSYGGAGHQYSAGAGGGTHRGPSSNGRSNTHDQQYDMSIHHHHHHNHISSHNNSFQPRKKNVGPDAGVYNHSNNNSGGSGGNSSDMYGGSGGGQQQYQRQNRRGSYARPSLMTTGTGAISPTHSAPYPYNNNMNTTNHDPHRPSTHHSSNGGNDDRYNSPPPPHHSHHQQQQQQQHPAGQRTTSPMESSHAYATQNGPYQGHNQHYQDVNTSNHHHHHQQQQQQQPSTHQGLGRPPSGSFQEDYNPNEYTHMSHNQPTHSPKMGMKSKKTPTAYHHPSSAFSGGHQHHQQQQQQQQLHGRGDAQTMAMHSHLPPHHHHHQGSHQGGNRDSDTSSFPTPTGTVVVGLAGYNNPMQYHQFPPPHQLSHGGGGGSGAAPFPYRRSSQTSSPYLSHFTPSQHPNTAPRYAGSELESLHPLAGGPGDDKRLSSANTAGSAAPPGGKGKKRSKK